MIHLLPSLFFPRSLKRSEVQGEKRPLESIKMHKKLLQTPIPMSSPYSLILRKGLIAFLLPSFVTCASAQILLYDGFSAGTDNANGEYIANPSGATDGRYQLTSGQAPLLPGFTGSWSGSGFELGVTQQPTLNYMDAHGASLQTSGNAAFRDFGLTSNSSRAIDSSVGLGVDNTTRYFSYLVQLEDATTLGRISFSEGLNTITGGGLRIRTDGTNYIASVSFSNTTLFTADTDAHLFVWKVTFGATDSWSLWVDPSDLTTEDAATITGSAVNLDPAFITFQVDGGGNGMFLVDEIRIGNTWGDVTPTASAVPEPSSLAIFSGLGALAFLVRRRNRKA